MYVMQNVVPKVKTSILHFLKIIKLLLSNNYMVFHSKISCKKHWKNYRDYPKKNMDANSETDSIGTDENFDDFDDFAPDTDDESADEEELLEAYTHTTRAYSHGVTLERYTNTGARQLTLRDFARVIRAKILDIYDNGLLLLNITLKYDTSGKGYRYRTITVKKLSEYGDITTVIMDDNSFHTLAGGSDKDYSNGDEEMAYWLLTSYFEITTIGHSGGSVKTVTMGKFAKLLNTSSDDHDCVFDCISYVTKRELDIEKIRKYLNIRKFATISVEHVPKIARLAKTTACVYEDMLHYVTDAKGGVDIRGLKLLSGDEKAEIKLVLKNKHYYLLVSLHDEETQLYELRQLVDAKEIMDPEISKRDDCIYMFFDYETTNSPTTQVAVPYCFSYVVYDTANPEMVRDVILRTTDGEDDINAFYDNIQQVFSKLGAGRKCRKYMIGYNNSGFDNFLLIRQAMHSNIPVRNVLVDSGNRLLTMVYSHFKVFDLYRILTTSLKKACKSFGIEKCKLELAHHEIQDVVYRGKFEEYMVEHEDKIVEYALRDVESLCELFLKVKEVVREQTVTDDKDGLVLEDEYTTASMTYKAFKNTLTDDILDKIPILSLKMDDIIRQAVIGGRTQVFVKGEYSGKIRCIDVTSLYPYIMMTREFPLGQPKYTKFYVKNKIGVYHVTIHKQPKDKIIPFRSKEESLDWEYEGVMETWVTQEDIRIMEKFGASFAVISGYYWEESSKNIFRGYMEPLMMMKMEQDALKEKMEKLQKEGKHEEAEKVPYNGVLREMLKLWLNALSGKVIQRVFREEKRFCFDGDSVEKALNNLGNLKAVSSVEDVTIISAEVKYPLVKVPSIWGVLIYSYSRSYMYENFLSKSETKLAMDTDSLFLDDWEYKKFVKDMPELFGGEPGQMKEELGENMYGIFKAKKFYIIYSRKDELTDERIRDLLKKGGIERGDEIIQKVRWKGVHDTDKVITNKNIVNLINDNVLTSHQLFALYYFWLDGKHTSAGWEKDIENNPKIPFQFVRKIGGKTVEIPPEKWEKGDDFLPMGMVAYDSKNFRDLCDGGTVYVLCNQLRKNIMRDDLCKISINNVFIMKKFS